MRTTLLAASVFATITTIFGTLPFRVLPSPSPATQRPRELPIERDGRTSTERAKSDVQTPSRRAQASSPAIVDPSRLITLFSGDQAIDCTATHISPYHVLTTASCVSKHTLTHVEMNNGNTSVYLIENSWTTLHPRWSADGPSRFDVALLHLTGFVLPSKPLSLGYSPGATPTNLVQVHPDGSVRTVSVTTLSECADLNGLVIDDSSSSALLCAHVDDGPTKLSDPMATASATAATTARPLLHAGVSSVLMFESQGEWLLHAIELPLSACADGRECAHRAFLSVYGVANFINAFAWGFVWGPTPTDPPTSPPTLSPTVPTPTPSTGIPTPTPPATPVPTSGTPGSYLPTDEPPEPIPSPTTAAPPTNPPGPPTPFPTSAPPPRPSNGYPYVTGLRVQKEGHNFCGGTLVGPYHVLTAAHCVEDGIVSWVAVGSPSSSGSTIQTIRVEKVVVHPQFKSTSSLNDVAVVQLANYATGWDPLDLGVDKDTVSSDVGTLLSFGKEPNNGLKALTLPIWRRSTCEAQFPNVDASVLCAGGERGVDACSGDSGSPLIVVDPYGRDVLVGLVSAGFGCGQAGVPGFYTHVAMELDFILGHVIRAPEGPVPLPLPSVTYRPTASGAPEPLSVVPSSSETPRSDSSGKDGVNRPSTKVPVSTKAPISNVVLNPSVDSGTKANVLTYLVGSYAFLSTQASEVRTKLLDPRNEVVLYSTGELQGILDVINRHSAQPLNQRVDRFSAGRGASDRSSSQASCPA